MPGGEAEAHFVQERRAEGVAFRQYSVAAYRRVAVTAFRGQGAGSEGSALIIGEPDAQVGVVAEVVVHLDQARMVESGGADINDKIIRAGGIRRGPELQQRLRNGVGDLSALCGGRYQGQAWRGRYLPELFIGSEEKSLVFLNRAAHRPAELIPVKRRLRAARLVHEEIGCIEVRIAEIFEHTAMYRIAAALGNDAHLSARPASEFGGRNAGLYGEFLDSVPDPEVVEIRIDLRVHVARAVPKVDVRLRARAGDVEAQHLSTSRGGQNSGSNQRQVQRLPAVQRHVANVAAVYHAAQCALIVFEQRRGGFHLYGIARGADFER